MSDTIPLFPLNTVLFPGGVLPLRIFEPRYLNMVRQCTGEQRPFGVVLLQEGREAGAAASFFGLGTTARIIDFDRLDDGTLGISCLGESRFRVVAHQVGRDQLIEGQVELLAAGPEGSADPALGSAAEFLRRILEQLEPIGRHLQPDYGSAAWVADRLAELLPLPLPFKQQLLGIDDGGRRLRLITRALNLGADRGRLDA